jgi:hypothetical protein
MSFSPGKPLEKEKSVQTGTSMVALEKPAGFFTRRRFAGGYAIHHSIQLDQSYRLHISFSPGEPLETTKNPQNSHDDVGASQSMGVSECQKVCRGMCDTPFDSAR